MQIVTDNVRNVANGPPDRSIPGKEIALNSKTVERINRIFHPRPSSASYASFAKSTVTFFLTNSHNPTTARGELRTVAEQSTSQVKVIAGRRSHASFFVLRE
jgi:hypothetical protein